MFSATPENLPANAVAQAHDIEVRPDDSEYQEVVACLPPRDRRECKILKVIRHQIPAALFNGGAGYRVSWSVLADEGHGERMHYTIYNRKAGALKSTVPAVSRILHRSRFYLGTCRHC